MAVPGWGDIYDELGVTPVINAIGSVTLLGGSQTSPTVREAMERANSAYVPLAELEDKAGGLIADMLGVESAYITSGAASALVLSTAAAMARDNDDFVAQLPDTTGMADEILIQKKQRYHYDRTLNFAGAKLIEYGTDEGTSEDDLEAAINDKTAALHYVANEKIKDPSVLTIEQVITIAQKHDIPVIVDAAGQVVRADPDGPGRRGVSSGVSASELPPGGSEDELEGVFVARQGRAVFVPVKTGIAGERYFEALDGIVEGDLIITGPFSEVRNLNDGDAIRVISGASSAEAGEGGFFGSLRRARTGAARR